MTAQRIVVYAFLFLGVALVLLSCLGVLVFRDVFDRLHFGSPTTLGAICITVAVMVKDSISLVGDKTILIAVFLVVAAPMITHAIGRAARVARHGDWRIQPDESIEVEERER
ncbi:MAG TPA: monovalent cation/H(+) antiporter subunit G [Solirubrobacteraceae bacterium]